MQNHTFEDVLAELHETARMLDDIRDSVDFLTVPKTKVQYAFEEREEPLILFRENTVSEVIEMILEYEEQGCSYDDDDDDGPCCNTCQRKLLCPCKDLVIDHVNVADDQ